jgi:hypothetical protein
MVGGAVAALAVGVLMVGPAGASSPGTGSGSGSAAVKAELTQAKAKLLVKSDFPHGWVAEGPATEEADNGGSDNFPGENQLATCLGLTPALTSALNQSTPEVDSPSFQRTGQNEFVQEDFDIYPSAKTANEDYASMTLPKVPACLTAALALPATKAQLQNSFGKGYTVGTATASAINPKALIPHTAGFVLSVPVTGSGVTLHVSTVVVGWARGTANPSVVFTTFDTAIPASFERHIETVAYDRS